MCVPYNQRNPKTRAMMVIANFSLVSGIFLWNLARPSGVAAHTWIDGLAGLLFGLSIGVNLAVLQRARLPCGLKRVWPSVEAASIIPSGRWPRKPW